MRPPVPRAGPLTVLRELDFLLEGVLRVLRFAIVFSWLEFGPNKSREQ
jgi:hypothetical protein